MTTVVSAIGKPLANVVRIWLVVGTAQPVGHFGYPTGCKGPVTGLYGAVRAYWVGHHTLCKFSNVLASPGL